MYNLMIFISYQMTVQTVKVKHRLKQIDRFKVCSYLLVTYKTVVHIGESTVEIKTEADSNDITESVYPLHDMPSTGMFGLYDSEYLFVDVFRVCIVFLLLLFLYTNITCSTVVLQCYRRQAIPMEQAKIRPSVTL